ncbi:MAG: MoaD family protein [Methanomassiliicoccales archaeon]|nr:MoaD family protein [Methanomassiliicoccales archaeon]
MVRVKMFATLQDISRTGEVDLKVDTVMSALEKLVTMFEKLRPEIFEDYHQRQLKDKIKVMVNGTNIDYLAGLGTKLIEGDRMAVFPVLAGG